MDTIDKLEQKIEQLTNEINKAVEIVTSVKTIHLRQSLQEKPNKLIKKNNKARHK